MAIQWFISKKLKVKETTDYQIDYHINGKRIRQGIGRNKQDAELARTQVQRNLMLGIYDLPQSQASRIKLEDLIAEFLEDKKIE